MASLAMLTDTEFFANVYAVPFNGLMLTANGYMSLVNGCTLHSNAPNVFKKTF